MAMIKWLFRYHKRHIIEVYDMALGESENPGIPLTAFRFRCLICGRFFDDICESGIEQLRRGIKKEDVFQWFREKKKPSEEG